MKKIICSLIIFTFFISISLAEELGNRNPFRKPDIFGIKEKAEIEKEKYQEKAVSLENLKLTGIINGEVALINHRFVKKGEKIGAFTVILIEDNVVELEADGKKFQLILNLKKLKNENKDKKE